MVRRFVKERQLNYIHKQYGYRWAIFILAMLSILILIGCGEKKPKIFRVGILNGFRPFSDSQGLLPVRG